MNWEDAILNNRKYKKIFWQGVLCACEMMKRGRCPFDEHKAASLMLEIIEREEAEIKAKRSQIIDGHVVISLPCKTRPQIKLYDE